MTQRGGHSPTNNRLEYQNSPKHLHRFYTGKNLHKNNYISCTYWSYGAREGEESYLANRLLAFFDHSNTTPRSGRVTFLSLSL
jgi:hypothetical protein